MTKHRVLVCDDSAFARKVLREILAADPRLEVVDIARDGLDALEKIEQLKPDVVTLDLQMPELDGLGVLEALEKKPNAPRVVLVTMTDAESALAVQALQKGAFDVVYKPTAIATDRLYELGAELVMKVVAAARSATRAAAPPAAPVSAGRTSGKTRLVVIGTSTGGPRALTHVLSALPADFPVPIAAVVHMPVGYTEAFATRLDVASKLSVREAASGLVLERGTAVLARAGAHLRVRAGAGGQLTTWLEVRKDEDESLHCPSVDALFTSAAEQVGAGVLGVVMTGMGTDGLEGARAIHRMGGRLLVEAESTAVVYGMPRAVAEAKLGAEEVTLELMARAIALHI
ncbi:MAG: chemotaxis-specific protein-glutamate methyltransferase CheB [Labilithrix sp.]